MKNHFVNVFCTLVVAVCPLYRAWSQTTTAEKVLGPGWQCLLVPTSFDGPGTILSIDPDGTKSRIVDLSRSIKSSKAIPIKKEKAEIGIITTGSNMNVNVAVSMLQKIAPGLAKLWTSGHHVAVSKVEYQDVEEETTFDTDLKPILSSWLKQNSKEYMSGPPKTRYFIVRDAYIAGMVNYHFQRTVLPLSAVRARLRAFSVQTLRSAGVLKPVMTSTRNFPLGCAFASAPTS